VTYCSTSEKRNWAQDCQRWVDKAKIDLLHVFSPSIWVQYKGPSLKTIWRWSSGRLFRNIVCYALNESTPGNREGKLSNTARRQTYDSFLLIVEPRVCIKVAWIYKGGNELFLRLCMRILHTKKCVSGDEQDGFARKCWHKGKARKTSMNYASLRDALIKQLNSIVTRRRRRQSEGAQVDIFFVPGRGNWESSSTWCSESWDDVPAMG
jgi:hypothetical protein